MTNSKIKASHLMILVLLLFCILAVNVYAKQTGSIILKSGDSFDNVTFTVDKDYKIVVIQFDTWAKRVSFKDIAKITDQDNYDITSEILGDLYKPVPQETWISEDSEVIKQTKAKMWNGLIRVSGDYSFPTGDYYEGTVSGLGIEGDIRFTLNYQLALRFMVSRSGMKVDDDFYIYSLDPDISIINQEWGFRTMRYLVAIEYYKYLDQYKKDLSFYYVFAGLGAAVHRITSDLTLRYNPTNEVERFEESTSESKFAMTFGIGMINMITKEVGLDLSANVDLIAVGEDPTKQPGLYRSNIIYAYIFDIKFGLAYFF